MSQRYTSSSLFPSASSHVVHALVCRPKQILLALPGEDLLVARSTRSDVVQVSTVAFILRRDDQVLVEKRSESKRTDPGKHCIPSGGVEDGESYEDALLREVREEFGVTAKAYEHVCTARYEKPGVTFLMEYYVVTAWDGEINRYEAESLHWAPITPSSVEIEPDKEALQSLQVFD